jgi:hypothetical protein
MAIKFNVTDEDLLANRHDATDDPDEEYDDESGLDFNSGQTQRRFRFFEFKDLYEKECSLQKSSLATEYAVWFGQDKFKPVYPNDTNARMHLSRLQVEQLLPILAYFAYTGELPKTEDVNIEITFLETTPDTDTESKRKSKWSYNKKCLTRLVVVEFGKKSGKMLSCRRSSGKW